MNTVQMMQHIRSHPVLEECGIGMQLGLPFLFEHNGMLNVRLWPHRETVRGDEVALYVPAYRIEFIYPFLHLRSFRNLVMEGIAGAGEFAQVQCASEWLQKLEAMNKTVYESCDCIFQQYAENRYSVAAELEKHRTFVMQGIQMLGLSKIYAAEVGSDVLHSCL